MMSWTVFDFEISDHIAHIRFNRPDQLNSFTAAMWSELPEVVRQIDDDNEARVIVISSSGKHFTAGMDLSVFSTLQADDETELARANATFVRLIKTLQETFTPLAKARQPVIAAVQGGCIGAGLDLVTACDLRYATPNAFFSLHEINIGMTADVGTFPRLQKLIPQAIAREMAFTGEPLSAERAERLGFINGVFDDPEALLDGVMDVAEKIAAKSPMAIWGSKEMLNYGAEHNTADTLDHVATWQGGMFSHQDIKAAITAQQRKQQADFEDLGKKKELK
jgi:enoyl-CoA hydratase